MRKRMTGLVVLLAVAGLGLATGGAAAQEPGRTFGFGVGLQPTILIDDDIGVLGALAPQFFIPIAVGENLMLEPSFGILRVTQFQEMDSDRFEFTATIWRLGAGLLFMRDAGPDGRTYFGPRLGLIRSRSESESPFSTSESSQLSIAIAGVGGGEFFLADGFSLGGELGLEYVRLGDPDTQGEPEGLDEGGSLLRTIAELRIRWYVK